MPILNRSTRHCAGIVSIPGARIGGKRKLLIDGIGRISDASYVRYIKPMGRVDKPL